LPADVERISGSLTDSLLPALALSALGRIDHAVQEDVTWWLKKKLGATARDAIREMLFERNTEGPMPFQPRLKPGMHQALLDVAQHDFIEAGRLNDVLLEHLASFPYE